MKRRHLMGQASGLALAALVAAMAAGCQKTAGRPRRGRTLDMAAHAGRHPAPLRRPGPGLGPRAGGHRPALASGPAGRGGET